MNTLKEFLARLLAKGRTSPVLEEPQRFLLLSIVIGIFSGLVVVCFHVSIEYLGWYTIHSLPPPPDWAFMLWPAIGALVSYTVIKYLVPTARGTGVNYTKTAVYASDGYVPFRSVLGKFATSTISIGTGNPMGPEDPALQMGAGIASLLGRIFHLTKDHMRLIAPIGAAAGIGAAFNTPITAVLFVMEEVVSAWSYLVLGSIVLSSVSAVVVSRWFLGDEPLYRVPGFEFGDYSELLVYAVIGIVGGCLAALFTKQAIKLRGFVLGLPDRGRLWLPAVAGLAVGVVGLYAPETLGAGYGVIDGALHERFRWEPLLIFAMLKFATTTFCFSCGTPGGLFAPALYIGAMLGGGVGGLASELGLSFSGFTGPFVLVGIGTFFAGLFRAPMTSVFMVFELSASYQVILPVMIANTVAILVSKRLQHDSVAELAAHQDGLDLPSIEEQRETPVMKVEDAMRRDRDLVVQKDLTVSEAVAKIDSEGSPALLVEIRYGQWAWIDERTTRLAESEGKGEHGVHDALHMRSVMKTHPDVPLDQAMRNLGRYPLMPVTSRVNSSFIVGTLQLEDVHRAYGISAEADRELHEGEAAGQA